MTMDYTADGIGDAFDDAFGEPARWQQDETTDPIDITVVTRRFVNRNNDQPRQARYDAQITLAALTPELAQGNVITLSQMPFAGRYAVGRAYYDSFNWQIAYARRLPDSQTP